MAWSPALRRYLNAFSQLSPRRKWSPSDALELAEPAGVELLHRLADAGMKLAPLRREEALVGDLLGQGVLEDVLELGSPAELPDELFPFEVGEVGLEALGFGQAMEDAVGEDPADHGGLLGDSPRLVGQPVEPGHQDAAERVGDGDALDERGRYPAATVRGAGEGAALDERADDLLDVERVALGLADDQGPGRGRQLGGREEAADEVDGRGLGQRAEGHRREPVGVASEDLGAERRMVGRRAGHADDRQRQLLGQWQDVLEQLDRARVGPVEVLHHEDRRPPGGQSLEQAADEREQALPERFRREGAEQVRLGLSGRMPSIPAMIASASASPGRIRSIVS